MYFPTAVTGGGQRDSDATAWDAREALHVRRAVSDAAMRDEPSPHLYVENVFSPAMYAAILRHFPTDSVALRPWDADGAFGNYDSRREINVPREAQRLPPDQRAFWLDAATFFHGVDFFRMLLERFEPYARARFGDRIDDPAFFREHLRGRFILNQHEVGYYLGPHTDRSERVFTCLFYFPEHDRLEHLGTTLYRPLEPGFTCSGATHHNPARFERRETIPYRPNSVLVLARTDVLFHGVHSLTAEQLRGSRRRGMQVQFIVNNERSRESCKTTLRVIVPAVIRAGGDETVPVRLTNHASSELDSEYPYPTQLGCRWLDEHGREVESNNTVRTALPRRVGAGETIEGSMRIVAPHAPGRYVLRLSVVQEGVAWFDDIDPNNGTEERVLVYDPVAAEGAAAVEATTAESPCDIIPQSHDIALGDGWYPVERSGAAAFRWVDNGAVVHVAALRPVRHALRIVVEPGPGVGLESFRLSARLADGREIGTATVSGKQTVVFALPPESPCVFSVALHAVGGGKVTPNDSRVLNFRVFSASIERTEDVFPSWAVPASGFYPLERNEADRFRWVGGDAIIELHPTRRDTLEFDAESGPGMRSQPFRLHVVGSDGIEIVSAEIGSRTHVTVPLRGADGSASLLLRADGGGAAAAGDPRTLNFRVFAPRT